MFDIEARVMIGWYSLASQSERVPTRCFYVKVAYLSYGEYIILVSARRERDREKVLFVRRRLKVKATHNETVIYE